MLVSQSEPKDSFLLSSVLNASVVPSENELALFITSRG